MWTRLFLLICCAGPFGWAQQDDQPAQEPASPPEEALTETQRETRAVSLQDLQQADERLDSEREALAKRERRLNMLLEDFNNQSRALETKEATINKLLGDLAADKTDEDIPDVQVAHWESRDPQVAARDFVLLYGDAPRVAVSLVKRMKKKKSARLIDEVAKLGDNGKKVAAKLHEAIGVGRLANN